MINTGINCGPQGLNRHETTPPCDSATTKPIFSLPTPHNADPATTNVGSATTKPISPSTTQHKRGSAKLLRKVRRNPATRANKLAKAKLRGAKSAGSQTPVAQGLLAWSSSPITQGLPTYGSYGQNFLSPAAPSKATPFSQARPSSQATPPTARLSATKANLRNYLELKVKVLVGRARARGDTKAVQAQISLEARRRARAPGGNPIPPNVVAVLKMVATGDHKVVQAGIDFLVRNSIRAGNTISQEEIEVLRELGNEADPQARLSQIALQERRDSLSISG